LKKNPLYWQAGKIRLETIDMPYVTSDNTASFNLFKADSVAMANLTVETIPDALQRGDSLYRFSTGSVYYLGFNFRESRLTRELQLRKAIQAVIDPRVIVNKVIAMPGLLAADSLFPVTVRGVSKSFREEFPAPQVKRGLDVARAYLDAYSTKQSSTLPPLILLINDTPLAARQAEYLQQLFKTALNIDIRIDKQVFKQYLEKMRRGEFDLSLAGWGPDYDDAMTFADLMASWNENNRGQYQSERYDALVRAAMAETDSQRRLQYMAQLQTVIAEEVPLIPLFENAEIYVQHPNLKGVARSIFGGDPNYRFAWLEAK
jgi:oligopeptide transport system substrate-binding protein